MDELESPNKKEDIEELLSSFVYEDFCSELPIIKPITLTNIKQKTVNLNDTLLISKYRKDYETVILNVDDLVNSMMLKTIASIDTGTANTPAKIVESMKMLNELSMAKDSLNKVMKFVENAS